MNAFKTTGVDLAGPLYLKHGGKVWIVLFICAVYRCVHIDFVMSLSTEAFVNVLWRFVNVCGQPKTVYSDNGTNFMGTVNLCKKLNCPPIELKELLALNRSSGSSTHPPQHGGVVGGKD